MPEIDEFRRPANRIARQAHSVRSSEMWTCPKCREKVDESFEVCWSCGTTPEGIEDPDFVTTDEAEPIEDPPLDLDPKVEELLEDEFAVDALAGTRRVLHGEQHGRSQIRRRPTDGARHPGVGGQARHQHGDGRVPAPVVEVTDPACGSPPRTCPVP